MLSIPRPEDADVNHDGRVTTGDAVLIMQFAVGLRTSFDFQSPRVVAVVPSSGTADVLVTSAVNLFFSEPVLPTTLSGALSLIDGVTGQPVAGTIESSPASVAVNFVPSLPLLPARLYRVRVTTAVTDGENNALQAPFESTFQTQALGSGVLVSTVGVEAPINELLPEPISFRALNASGQPVRQVPVSFTALMGAGMFEPSGKRQVIILTDDTGLAQVSFRLGGQATEHTIDIRAPGFSVPPLFTARALPLSPANLRVYSGNNQSGPPGGTSPFPLVVEATDAGGNPVAGTTITFTVTQGQGQFGGQPSVDVPTDSSGTASTPFTFGASAGAILVQASFPGMVGQAPVFSLQTLIPQPSSPTAIVGRVIDAQSLQPLNRVYVYLADSPSTWDWTDENGFFRLVTTPGPHTVDVDGFESGAIDGQLYPVVAIPVNAVEGQENEIGMPALLPRLEIDSFLDVSDTQGGTLTLRSNPDWKLYVAPGQARFANGTGTGRLYVASVPPDRIPMPPAGGKISNFFDTIQPLNVRFVPPAPVVFPNSDGLPAGTVTDIYTLSYSSGVFLKTGRAQVSEDGRLLSSLPGEGITAGGWHQAPPPKARRTACLRARAILPIDGVYPNVSVFGLISLGVKSSFKEWLFNICNIPADMGPVNPIFSWGSNNRNSGPGTGNGGQPGNSPDPYKDPGNGNPQPDDRKIDSLTFTLSPDGSVEQDSLNMDLKSTGKLIVRVTMNPATASPVGMKFQVKISDKDILEVNGQRASEIPLTFSAPTLTVPIRALKIGQTQVSAADVPSNVVTATVLASVVFKDQSGDTAITPSPPAFKRRGEAGGTFAELGLNTPGATGNSRHAFAHFIPPESAPDFTFVTLGAVPFTYSPISASADKEDFTFSGNNIGPAEEVGSLFSREADGSFRTRLAVTVFKPTTRTVRFFKIKGVSPSNENAALQGASDIWSQANVGFTQVGSISEVDSGTPIDIDEGTGNIPSAHQAAIIDKINQSGVALGNINVVYVSKIKARDGNSINILGQEVTPTTNGRSFIFIANSIGGNTGKTLAHEIGHSLLGGGHRAEGYKLMYEA